MSDPGEPMRSYALDELMVQIIADYRTTDARLSAFLQVFLDEVTLPIEATLLGMPVEITEFDYFNDGRGLVARCLRPGADQYLTLADLVLAPQSVAAWIHAAYRQWLGMTPHSVLRPPDWELALDEAW
ncbi:MAG: hypothetical protein M3R63_25450 [Actinomycetota bacterium]|nr:hypothetical protein [Actinomycetota bacterium]